MTEPNDFDQVDAQLPGLEPGPPGQGKNEEAARRTIKALKVSGLLAESHSVMCEALLTAARQLDRASSSARAKDYGVANLLAQLRETYLVLVSDVDKEGGERSAWDDFLDDLANGVGGGAPVRDPAEPTTSE